MNKELDYQEWNCTKCGHKWVNRKPGKPRWCPKCIAYKYIVPASNVYTKQDGDNG